MLERLDRRVRLLEHAEGFTEPELSLRDHRMVRSQGRHPDLHRATPGRGRVCVVLESGLGRGKVAQRVQQVGMVLAQQSLVNLQRPPQHFDRFDRSPTERVHPSQIAEHHAHIVAAGPLHALDDPQCLTIMGKARVGIGSLGDRVREGCVRGPHEEVVGTERSACHVDRPLHLLRRLVQSS